MLIIEKQIMINLPHAECWEKVKDISLAHNYIPNVEKIEIVTPHKEGLGASRKAYLTKGKKIVDETVTEWIDKVGFTLKLEVAGKRVLPWFNKFYFRYHIEKADHKTLFRPGILYEPRVKILVGLQRKVFDCVMGRELKVICASMKAYYETDRPTSAAGFKAIRNNIH